MVALKEWAEEDHPRDEAGKFTDGGGSSSAKKPSEAGKGLKAFAGAGTPAPKREWTDKLPPGIKHDETWKTHFNGHPDKGGLPSEERAKLHSKLIHDATAHVPSVPAGQRKIAIMTMGAPASGKSAGLAGVDKSNFVHIDPDDLKGKLPEYQKAVPSREADKSFKPGTAPTYKGAAGMAHEESSFIAKHITDIAIANNQNVIVDGTGANLKSMLTKIDRLKKAGYEIHLNMSHLNESEGLKRMASRSDEVGRYVPEQFVKDAYKSVPKNFPAIAAKVDSFKVFDAREKGSPLRWESKNGKETHHSPEFVKNFKKNYGHE